ncbi:MAG TPA: tail fiber domain-containing protein, partial [Panacibacter sp.]|nr:tail fiber domain-containing protein [Panacibacter sp.]
NIANGYAALFSNTTGYSNIAIGNAALYHNVVGHDMVAIGDSALFNQNSMFFYYNTALGSKSLYSNTTGYFNTANGAYALYSNTTGYENTASGLNVLVNNTTGNRNTAIGYNTLYSNITGGYNTGNGTATLYSNTTGSQNTANGYAALFYNTTGSLNTANGNGALGTNTTGYYNTADGDGALFTNTAGNNNTALGNLADVNAGNYNNTTLLGNLATGTASNQVRIGNNAVTSIGGYADWTNISDGRVKKNIKENVPGLAFINKLKPVTYNLNLDVADKLIQRPEIKDNEGKAITEKPSSEQLASRKAKEQIIYTGFVAQEVEKAAKELNYDFSGVDAAKNDKDLYGLRYASFVVPLVKAVQELSKQNEDLRNEYNAKINAQQKQIDDLKAMITGKQATSSLEQNIPNPFKYSTTISYTLPQQYNTAKIVITDNTGRSLKEINISGNGKGSISVDASLFSNGSYHYSLYVDGKIVSSKQMVLTK